MRRREFVKLLAGSALAQPLTAWAQPTTKVYRLHFCTRRARLRRLSKTAVSATGADSSVNFAASAMSKGRTSLSNVIPAKARPTIIVR